MTTSPHINLRWLGLVLVGVCVLLAGGIYGINKYTVEQVLMRDAEGRSKAMAHYFGENYPNIETVVAGGAASPQGMDFARISLGSTGAERFLLYSQEGTLRLDTNAEGEEHDHEEKVLGSHNPEAFAAIKASETFAKLEVENEGGIDKLIAETYVPIKKDGKTIGVAEVYVDQTADAVNFRTAFGLSSILIAALAAAVFAFPAIGFQLRSRQKQEADRSIAFLASHDALTGMPNRASFREALIKGMDASQEDDSLTAVHFVDIDHFKDINDENGHAAGDEILRSVAMRLQQSVRSGDVVARYGGDEFVVAQFGIGDENKLAAATSRIVNVFKPPFRIEGKEMTITSSIGTAVSRQDGRGCEALVNNADTAVYVVKARGRDGHCFFEDEFNVVKQRRVFVENQLRRGLSEGRFTLNFQPLVKVCDGSVKGFEALLRLKDGNGAQISPAEFIPVAEEIGLIDEIGKWVLEHSCAAAAMWPPHLQVSVNLSAAQFKRRSVVGATRAALAASGLAPQRLLLEITESLLMSETSLVLNQLQELKAMGTSIVMDDFGTGYSSLGYMLKFPFDQIKIDRSFIAAMESGNQAAQSLVRTIVALGHTMQLNVTAEGVETQAQFKALQDIHCDSAQGYLLGKPMPEDEVAPWLLNDFRNRNIAFPEVTRAQDTPVPAAAAMTA